MMDTPSAPGNGSGKVSKHASRAAGTAQKAAGGTAKGAAGGAEGAARDAGAGAKDTAATAARGASKAGAQVTALPGKVAGLAKLLTLGRLLRAVPVVGAAAAGVVVGRITARKR
ncbi:hypothetical protein LUW76_03085 [Actinomadura madurae]|uniref:hypothetical protein n=1 Tax=Actinomadura madurae TaxID=1993 RepID=UPI0020275277|nr:hypothetical protein [Actinomadura madurae]URM93392.1 hypothetical protein LUW76_03085 [Actinomadura madurae]URN04123.1 hypothetical protein LUW74_12830 [Actinomadura madurae]